MLKIRKALTAEKTGRRELSKWQSLDIVTKLDCRPADYDTILDEYIMQISVGASVKIPSQDLEYVKDLLIQQIVRFLYGDVDNALHEIMIAVYEHDREKALELITDLRKELK